MRHLPHSSSSSRRTASQAGFLLLSQSGERPLRYVESFRFETMPSSPILQACANTVGPSPSMCLLNRMPGPTLARVEASAALRTSSGLLADPIFAAFAAHHYSGIVLVNGRGTWRLAYAMFDVIRLRTALSRSLCITTL